jgi:HPt (histidine-containing phosphotransfer) domain-containing protein
MSTVLEIESAIEKLSPQDQQQLRDWLQARVTDQQPVLQKLRSLAGKGRNLPEDLAANHDHYLHGTPKRS